MVGTSRDPLQQPAVPCHRPVSAHAAAPSSRETQEESDFERSPAWLARALELPLRAEANAVARGVRLPVGLSILAVLERA
jgi:hypothetical protein